MSCCKYIHACVCTHMHTQGKNLKNYYVFFNLNIETLTRHFWLANLRFVIEVQPTNIYTFINITGFWDLRNFWGEEIL